MKNLVIDDMAELNLIDKALSTLKDDSFNKMQENRTDELVSEFYRVIDLKNKVSTICASKCLEIWGLE